MIHTISRRALLGTAAAFPAAGALASCTGGDEDEPPGAAAGDHSQPERLRVVTGLGLFQGREAYLPVAVERGYFAAENIEVELLPGEGTEENLRLLEGGQTDIATIDVNAGMEAYASGTFVNWVLTAVLHTQMLGCVMVLESSGMRRPRDLAGTTMAVIPGGTNTVLFPAFAELTGFDPDSVEFVAPPPPSFGAALASGQVDAIQQFVVNQRGLESEVEEPVVVFPYAEWLPELYGSALGCTRELVAENPELVRRFNRAALRGLEDAVSDPEQAGQIFEQRLPGGQPAVVAGWENELLAGYVRLEDDLPRGAFSESRLARTVGVLESLGVVEAGLTPEDFVAFDLYS